MPASSPAAAADGEPPGEHAGSRRTQDVEVRTVVGLSVAVGAWARIELDHVVESVQMQRGDRRTQGRPLPPRQPGDRHVDVDEASLEEFDDGRRARPGERRDRASSERRDRVHRSPAAGRHDHDLGALLRAAQQGATVGWDQGWLDPTCSVHGEPYDREPVVVRQDHDRRLPEPAGRRLFVGPGPERNPEGPPFDPHRHLADRRQVARGVAFVPDHRSLRTVRMSPL